MQPPNFEVLATSSSGTICANIETGFPAQRETPIRETTMRRLIPLSLFVVAGVVGYSCNFNPQPDPPVMNEIAAGGGDGQPAGGGYTSSAGGAGLAIDAGFDGSTAGAGGMATGGWGQGGSGGTGGAGGAGGITGGTANPGGSGGGVTAGAGGVAGGGG